MKEISVSTEVFARIWSLRKAGEENEDAILKRVLQNYAPKNGLQRSLEAGAKREASQGAENTMLGIGGLLDARYGVRFPEGFEIERTYLGRRHRAQVRNGRWVLEGQAGEYLRLNELSKAIGTKTENAWVNWFFIDAAGRRRAVSELRARDSIASRRQAGETTVLEAGKLGARAKDDLPDSRGSTGRWCDDVRTALVNLGRIAPLSAIYREVERIRQAGGRTVPQTLEAVVRRTLEDFSSDSENFRGQDWFTIVEGKGNGVWGLRDIVKGA